MNFKKVSVALVLILVINLSVPALISSESDNNITLVELIKSLSDEEQKELSNITINLSNMELDEINRLVEKEKSEKIDNSNKSYAAWGAYITKISVCGLGTICIYTGGIIVAGIVVYAGSILFKKVKKFVLPHIIGFSIPKNLRKSSDTVDLGKFKDKNGNTPINKNSGKFSNGRWSIDKDTAGHGGRKWKVKHNGKRVVSLDSKGKIIVD